MMIENNQPVPRRDLVPHQEPSPIPRDLIKEIAMDIGKEVAAHIETMYPKAVEAASKSMLLSVRNTTFNQIMDALEVVDEAEIRRRLEARKVYRRRHKAAWKAARDTDWEAVRNAKDA